MTGINSGSVFRDDMSAVSKPQHHPSEAHLVDYVAGSGSYSWELFIDVHLSLCAECRDQVAKLRALGGALLDQIPHEDLPEGMEERVLDLLDSAEITSFPVPKHAMLPDLPRSVTALLPGDPSKLSWDSDVLTEGEALCLGSVSEKENASDASYLFLLKISAGERIFINGEIAEFGYLLVLDGGLLGDECDLSVGDITGLDHVREKHYAIDDLSLTYCLLLLTKEAE
ncbi:cupin domain-containing protein [Kiloniella spongiae]|uniref:hypothetical protein n=1 Tax=Kiloniella spongiae TaxID=1489064 RepID=UPI00069ABC14|nr:hypothetical protein [Kiloniella spongiae]